MIKKINISQRTRIYICQKCKIDLALSQFTYNKHKNKIKKKNINK